MRTILVIDSSTSVRETLRIVLRSEYDVTVMPSRDDVPTHPPPALVILGLPLSPRDGDAADVTLRCLAPDVPLLLLNGPAEVDVHQIGVPGRRVEFLPKPFDAYALRSRVRALLADASAPRVGPELEAEHRRRYLEFPFLSRAAVAIARQATATDVPVLFVGERGTGALDVARAMHFFGGRSGPFAAIQAARLHAGELGARAAPSEGHRAGASVYLEAVELASPEAQQELLAVVRGHVALGATAPLRIFAWTSDDLMARAQAGDFLPELAYALSTFPLPLASLRDRAGDIPALVDSLTAAIVTRLRLEPVSYTQAALESLTQYLWFGNIAELEAVLGRTLALHRPRVVEPQHLVFFPSDVVAAVAPSAARVAPGGTTRPAWPSSSAATPSLEILLGELAHELRNPMVTIKTFAQHLDSVLNDPEVRARFSLLTADAIGRMDRLLETLLDFARFRVPVPQPTDVAALLDRALAEFSEELARKGVRIERGDPSHAPVMVNADEHQVLFALRNLLSGLIRDLVVHEPMRVLTRADGTLELRVFLEPTTAARLAAYVEEATGAPADTVPLPITLAAALLQRNAGALRVRTNGDGATVITLAWVGSG